MVFPIFNGTGTQVNVGDPVGRPKKFINAVCKCCGLRPDLLAAPKRSTPCAPCWAAFIANSWTKGDEILPSAHRCFKLSVNGVSSGGRCTVSSSLRRMPPRRGPESPEELAAAPADEAAALGSGFRPRRSRMPPFRFIGKKVSTVQLNYRSNGSKQILLSSKRHK